MVLRTALGAAARQTMDGFNSLRGSPRELYLIFVLKVLESYNYFSLSRSMTLYLTEEFGISDYRAGTLYGAWGTLLTAYGFLLGGAIDFLGVKASLIVCFVLNISSRLIMASTTSSWLMLVMLLGPNTIAGALGVPVMTIGVKRYTHETNRGFAFSLFYSLMNVAALTQGMLMDVFRIGFKHGFNVAGLGEHSLLNNGFRLFLASGCLTSLVGLCISFFLADNLKPPMHAKGKHAIAGTEPQREEHNWEATGSPELPLMVAAPSAKSPERVAFVDEILLPRGTSSSDGPAHIVALKGTSGEHLASGSGSQSDSASTRSKSKPLPGALASALESIKAVLSSRGFWKYMCMCVFTVNLKSIFRHLDATLPKYQLRAFGCNTPIGLIYSINPAMIVLLVPIVGAMTTGYSHFNMIHYGGYISALSPFWMVAFDTEWASAVFVTMLSLGEAIWSPRWYDYSMGVAPEGREGVFTALASAPLFAAMLPTGMISGKLLQTYCPDRGQCKSGGEGEAGPSRSLLALAASGGSLHARGLGAEGPTVAECDGRLLWLIVGCITLSSPLAILLTQPWIRPHPQDFAKVGLLPTHRTETEGEHMDYSVANPAAMVENVFQARNEPQHHMEVLGVGPGEGSPLLTIHHGRSDSDKA